MAHETSVTLRILVVVFVVNWVVRTLWNIRIGSVAGIALTLSTIAVLVAGPHLYLAAREDGDGVPVDARWRFVTLVVWVVAVSVVGYQTWLATAPKNTVVPYLVGCLVVGAIGYWWVLEARDGYHESRPETQGNT